jgi:hypothetical protein
MPDGAAAIAAPRRRRRAPRRRTTVSRFDVPAFLLPQSREELRELAELMALAGWAPHGYRDAEGNYLRPRIEMAILHGASVGLGPVASVQSIAVIEGMPTIWGDGAMALIERSGLLEDMSEEYVTDDTEGLTAICTMRRRGRPTPVTNRFSMAMAEQAHLLEKEGPWQSYPQRMLKMRARSWTIRDGFADVLRGLHLREEVDDFVGSAVVAFPHRLASRGAPRTRRTSKIGSGVDALWSLGSASAHASAVSHTERDAASVQAQSDSEAVRASDALLDSVSEAAGAEDAVSGAESLSADIAPSAPDAAAPNLPVVSADFDGTVGAPRDVEAMGAACDQVVDDSCPPPDQPPERQSDAEIANSKDATALPSQPSALNQDWAVSGEGEERPLPAWADLKQGLDAEDEGGAKPLPKSPTRQHVSLIANAERRAQPAPPRDPSGDSVVANGEREGSVSLLRGDQSRELTSVEGDASPSVRPDDRLQDLTTAEDKDVQPDLPARRGISFGHRWAVGRPKTLPRNRKPARRRSKDATSNPTLIVTIDPSWGDQRVFQYYRARLGELFDGGPAMAALVPRFRETNSAIEARLRQRLPHLIGQIDALFGETAR